MSNFVNINQIKQVTKTFFETTDGEQFDSQIQALAHQSNLNKKKVFIIYKSVIAIGVQESVVFVYDNKYNAEIKLEKLNSKKESNVCFFIREYAIEESSAFADDRKKVGAPFAFDSFKNQYSSLSIDCNNNFADYSTDATASLNFKN